MKTNCQCNCSPAVHRPRAKRCRHLEDSDLDIFRKNILLTLFLLDTANVARLEKRVAVGLPAEIGPIIMAATLEATGGLPKVGDDEKVAGGDAGLLWLLLLQLLLQGWMWR